MSDQRDGGIAWTDQTWNPTRGCSRVSPGCENCYAERVAGRFSGESQPYAGLVRKSKSGSPRWNGVVRFVPEMLDAPLKWRKPRRIFVNSMSDLFHETLSNEDIASVFAVMAQAQQHQFQVLTKRAQRMVKWFVWAGQQVAIGGAQFRLIPGWPLPNVWLGVSCEDQQRADERVPLLLAAPAAVRFVSAEPLLGPIDFTKIRVSASCTEDVLGDGEWANEPDPPPGIDWIIVGGESGPGARPCDVAWIRSIVAQCKAAGVACFAKQLGAHVRDNGFSPDARWSPNLRNGASLDQANHDWRIHLHDRKGGDAAEWPEDLRVREFPR